MVPFYIFLPGYYLIDQHVDEVMISFLCGLNEKQPPDEIVHFDLDVHPPDGVIEILNSEGVLLRQYRNFIRVRHLVVTDLFLKRKELLCETFLDSCLHLIGVYLQVS